jgi:polysaccharide biosynthesis protein PslH
MNLLFLSHRLPFPPNKGDKIRSHALFTHLAARHTVHLGCFIDDVEDFAYTNTVSAMAGSCKFIPLTKTRKLLRSALALLNNSSISAEVYQDAEMQQWVDTILQKEAIDCAVVFSSSMAPYLMAGTFLAARRVVFDMVDLDSDKWLQYSKTVGLATAWIYRREAKKLLELERAAAASFALTYLVSPYEVECFSRLAPESAMRIKPLSNGVNLNYFAPGVYASPFPQDITPIVMTGRMDYWPNVEGALWFANVVLPLIRRKISNAQFYVVGGQPASALRKLASPDIHVTGQVSDVRPFIAAAGVVVAPLRIARGVQNKVLEALAMGVPVVATVEASRGLAVVGDKDLWVANSAEDFASAVVNAAHSVGRDVIAANGRAYVEKFHNWNELLATIDVDLKDLGASGGKQQQPVMECL